MRNLRRWPVISDEELIEGGEGSWDESPSPGDYRGEFREYKDHASSSRGLETTATSGAQHRLSSL
jgi:hypothetical protein